MTQAKAKYRQNLPQLGEDIFLSDGGLETTMIFLEDRELPDFASFVLLQDKEGVEAVKRYYQTYIDVAGAHGTGFILESPTWRASPGWGEGLGYSADALAAANRESIELMSELRQTAKNAAPLVISGNIGPRGDGYVVGNAMSVEGAKEYHAWQIGIFADTEADLITALTMTYSAEAIGIVLATKEAGLPVVISFTVETDGRLPSGQFLHEAIEEVEAATGAYPAYYMVNCAHPSHFEAQLEVPQGIWSRIRGIRANASKCSHAELDNSTELDDGNPQEFGQEYAELKALLPQLNVFGGCCGTDHRHVEAIAKTCI